MGTATKVIEKGAEVASKTKLGSKILKGLKSFLTTADDEVAVVSGYIDKEGKVYSTLADDVHGEIAANVIGKGKAQKNLVHQLVDEGELVRYRSDTGAKGFFAQVPKGKLSVKQIETMQDLARKNKQDPKKIIWEYYSPGKYDVPEMHGGDTTSMIKDFDKRKALKLMGAAGAAGGVAVAGEAVAEENPFRTEEATDTSANPFREEVVQEEENPFREEAPERTGQDILRDIGLGAEEFLRKSAPTPENISQYMIDSLPHAVEGYKFLSIPANKVQEMTSKFLHERVGDTPRVESRLLEFYVTGRGADMLGKLLGVPKEDIEKMKNDPKVRDLISSFAEGQKEAEMNATSALVSMPLDPVVVGAGGISLAKKLSNPAVRAAVKLVEGQPKLAKVADDVAAQAEKNILLEKVEGPLQLGYKPTPKPTTPDFVMGERSAFDKVIERRGHVISETEGLGQQVEKLRGAVDVPSPLAKHSVFVAGEKIPREIAVQAGADLAEEQIRSQAQNILVAKAIKRSKTPSAFRSGVDDLVKKTIVSPDTALKAMGPTGARFAEDLQAIRATSEVKAGNAIQNYVGSTKTLSPEQKLQLVDYFEGRIKFPSDPRVANAVKVYDELRTGIKNEFIQAGGQKLSRTGDVVPFTGRSNYFPHQVPPVESLKKGAVRKEILEAAVRRGDFENMPQAEKSLNAFVEYVESQGKQDAFAKMMVKQGKAKTLAEAQYKLRTFVRPRAVKRFANLERTREIDLPFYDPNPDRVLPNYFQDAFRRIEEVKRFGPRDEVVRATIDQIREEGGDALYAYDVLRKFQGRELASKGARAVSESVRSYETITKLGLSQIVNAPQGVVNSVVKANVKSTLAGLRDILDNPEQAEEVASRVGAILNSTIKEVNEQMGGRVAGKFLNMTGFSATERFNRIVSANTAKHWIPELTERLQRNPNNQFVRRELKKLGLSADKILEKGLSQQELQEGMSRFVNLTQFRANPVDLPLYWSSPLGKVMTQFKSFAFNHAKFVKDEVIKEAARGNFRPALRYAVIGGIAGETTGTIVSTLRSRPRAENPAVRYFESLGYVGGVGLFSDLIRSAVTGRGAVLELLAGPSIGDTADFIENTGQVLKGNPVPLERQMIRQIPGIGPILQPMVLPSKKQQQPKEEEIGADIAASLALGEGL